MSGAKGWGTAFDRTHAQSAASVMPHSGSSVAGTGWYQPFPCVRARSRIAAGAAGG